MLASHLRSIAQRVRHAPGLRSLDGLWDSVRPLYGRTLDKLGEHGVEIQIAGCKVTISPKFAGTAWESIECDSYALFAETIRPGDVVYDIGAHIGTYSVLALQKSAPTGRVVAYEPVDLTREYLVRHLDWNLGRERAVVRPFCCGSVREKRLIYFRKGEMNGDSGLLPPPKGDSTQVEVRTLDSEVAELGLVPSVIKIDVEGWEFEVLKGAEGTIARHRPIIFLSLHAPALVQLGTSPEAVKSWLQARGYECQVISTDHEIHVLASPCHSIGSAMRAAENASREPFQ